MGILLTATRMGKQRGVRYSDFQTETGMGRKLQRMLESQRAKVTTFRKAKMLEFLSKATTTVGS